MLINVGGGPEQARAAQVWVPVMAWYLEQRRQLEQQVKKYSDPPSEHLLPDLPPHARCRYAPAMAVPVVLSTRAHGPALSPSSHVLMPASSVQPGIVEFGSEVERLQVVHRLGTRHVWTYMDRHVGQFILCGGSHQEVT